MKMGWLITGVVLILGAFGLGYSVDRWQRESQPGTVNVEMDYAKVTVTVNKQQMPLSGLIRRYEEEIRESKLAWERLWVYQATLQRICPEAFQGWPAATHSQLNVVKPLTRDELLHYNRCAEGRIYFQKQSQ